MTLFWLALAFVAGVVAGSLWSLPLSGPILIVAGGSLAAILLRARPSSLGLLIVAAFALGAARSAHHSPPTPSQVAFYNGRHVTLQGVVAEEPDIRDRGANYVVSVNRLQIGSVTRSVSGRVAVHTPRSELLDDGDAVSVAGLLVTPRDEPSAPFAQILARRGILSEMRFPRLQNLGPTNLGVAGWVVRLRRFLEDGINAWLPEPEAALLIAITLGAKSASLGDLTPILIATGLIHIIAISGIKVAMVAGSLYELLSATRRRTLTLAVSLLGLTAYVLLTGATVSGVRSAIMWALVFIAAYLGRGTVALVSLGFAAAVMVAVDPTLPWDTAFQLSTLGTLAIVSFTTPLSGAFRVVPSPFREALAVTAAAQLGTLPVVAFGFHVVSWSGLLANAVVLPLLPLLILMGFALGASSGLAAVAAPVGALADVLLRLIVQLSTWLSSAGAFATPSPTASLTAVYYLLLAAIAVLVLRRARWAPIGHMPRRGRDLSLALVAGASMLSVPLIHDRSHPGSQLLWLGTGNAVLLRSNGVTTLIDGSATPYRLLERLGDVLPYDIRTLDVVIVTDSRAGNVAGLDAVLAHYTVGEVLDVGAEYPSTTYATWRTDLRRRHIPMFALRTGAGVRVGAANIQALGPDVLYARPQDCVGLLRLTMPGRTILLAGSASAREQLEAVFRPVRLHTDTLVLGAKAGTSTDFLRAVHPNLVYAQSRVAGGRPVRRLTDGREISLTT